MQLQQQEQELQAQLKSKAREAQQVAGEQEAHAGAKVKELVSLTDKLAKQWALGCTACCCAASSWVTWL